MSLTCSKVCDEIDTAESTSAARFLQVTTALKGAMNKCLCKSKQIAGTKKMQEVSSVCMQS